MEDKGEDACLTRREKKNLNLEKRKKEKEKQIAHEGGQ